MALPVIVGFTKITGQFIRAILDGVDADRDPDGIPVPGLTITLSTPLVPSLVRTTGEDPKTILIDPIVLGTNADGIVVDDRGVAGPFIVASNDPDTDPNGWAWNARISGPTLPEDIRFSFVAPAGGEVDLTTVVRVPASPGSELRAWQTAVLQTQTALSAAEAARDAAISAGTTPEQVAATVNAYLAAHPPTVAGVVGLTEALTGKVSDDELATAMSFQLQGYVTAANLTNALNSYATSAAMNTAVSAAKDRGNHFGFQTADTITDGATNKVFTAAEKTKLAGITPGATSTTTVDGITDATAIGKSVIRAVDMLSARNAIGAGTSNLAIGTTSTTAKAGNYQPTAANISDATVIGRAVLKAADAPTARAALGAVAVVLLETADPIPTDGPAEPTLYYRKKAGA